MRYTKALAITLIVLLNSLPAWAQNQGVSGLITDENNDPMPFASVQVKGTTRGTTSNQEGQFVLALPNGQYTLVFQFVGYQRATRKVTVSSNQFTTVNVKMTAEVYQLEAVSISADAEDPAYAIIRNAQDKRKQYLNEVEAYTANAYVKGLQRIDKAPERILGMTVSIDTGIVYLSESVSELSYQAPDQIKERLVSSKVSGNNQAFSFNSASGMMLTFYRNLLLKELNERGYVSPIANGAMLYYDYKLEGWTEEEGRLINKIKVMPKRKNDPAFSGYIYIVEDEWRIHSADLALTKENQIEFVDSLRIRQTYTPTAKGPWVIFNQELDFKLTILGIEANGYYVGIYADYDMEPTFANKYFNNEVLVVEEGSNEKDSLYWQRVRPVPLTSLEIEDYRVKDSLSVIKESREYRDSVDRQVNKFSPLDILVGGYRWQNSFKKETFTVSSLLNSVQFNPVEGWVLNFDLGYNKELSGFRSLYINPVIRYGFSSKDFYGSLRTSYFYNSQKNASLSVGGGRFITQFDRSEPIGPYINSIYSLAYGENFMKLFDRTYAYARHSTELVNGLRLRTGLTYEYRRPLFNTTDFTWANREEGEPGYTVNNPPNIILPNTVFPEHGALLADVQFSISPGQKYVTRPDFKYVVERPWPTINIGIRQAFGQEVNYTRLTASTEESFSLGLAGTSEARVEVGTFLGQRPQFFTDFKHFDGQEIRVSDLELGNYQLLSYYFDSTNKRWLSGFYQHHFNGALLNKVPLIRRLKLQSVGSVNYLWTPDTGNYLEIGAGLEHIFKVLRVDYYVGLRAGQPNTRGLRIGFGF